MNRIPKMQKINLTSIKVYLKHLSVLLAFLLLGLLSNILNAQEAVYTSNGTFVVPEGVTEITVECWGGGGAGGGQNSNSDGGGGGGGGAYSKLNSFSVIEGQSFDFYVGTGGIGITGKGGDGGDTYFLNRTTCLAKGGIGGSPSTVTPPDGGTGGASTASVGDVKYSGGQGEKGRDSNTGQGGYGGSSAGVSVNGWSGPQTFLTINFPIASAPPGAGIGGNGGGADINGDAPASGNGGGGGGSGDGTSKKGGNGASGKIIIKWPVIAVSPNSINFGNISVGSSSSPVSYQLVGQNLVPSTSNITVTAPQGFEISRSQSSGYSSALTIPYTNGSLTATIYVRFVPTAIMDYSGNITNSGGGAATKNVMVTGSSNYCIPIQNSNPSNYYIYNVALGDIDNTTTALESPYYFHYNQSTNLSKGTSYSLTLRSRGSLFWFWYTNTFVTAWIDFDGDGQFEAEEKIGTASFGALESKVIDLTVPSSAQTGLTRMRVRSAYNVSTIDPCNDSGTKGETEDYDIIINSPIIVSATTTETCEGMSTGTITVTAEGGTLPYQYKLDNNPYQSSNIFTDLPAGTYSVTAKDANNTIGSTTAIISSVPITMPPANALVTNTTCNTSVGAIRITNIPSALEFTKAESDYVDLGGSLLNNLSGFTIEGWIKIDKSLVSGERTWGLFGQNDAIEFGIMNSSTLQLWTAGGGTLNVSLSSYPSGNDWHHIAGTGSGSVMKIYIDGVEVGSTTSSTSNYGSSAYHTVMGGHVLDATGNYLNGLILKASFRSVALTQPEILALSQSKFTEYTGNEPGMIAGFNFFEGTGNTMNSVGSSSGITANLMNTPEWVEVFSYSWVKAGNPSFTSNTKNISALAEGDYTLFASFPNICPVTGTWSVGVSGLNQWTGSISNDWNTTANWSCGIPDLSADANIPSGLQRYPLLKTGVAGMCKNLVLGTGTSVTVEDNTLQIAGNITNAGNILGTLGTLEFLGTSQQSIPQGIVNNTLKNVIINNPGNVVLNGPLNITGYLKARSGNLITNGFLTLISSASGTALIDGSGNGQVIGNVTMERYIPSAFGYKYFSSPFTAANVGQYADDVELSASFATFFSYDENQSSTGWDVFTNVASLLVPGSGYALNFGTSQTPKTVSTTGIVNNGTIGPLTVSNNNKTYTRGFNLVGNPYPSPIDWNAPGWNKTNVDNALYFFDAGTTDQYVGTYSTYINGVSSNGVAGNIIPAQQAFFVHVTDGSYPVTGSIEFTNEVRVNNLNPVFHKNSSGAPETIIRLNASFPELSSTPDFAVLYYSNLASEKFDPSLDALKILNTDITVPSLYLLADDNNELSIKSLKAPSLNDQVIRLGINSKMKGLLRLKANEISNLPIGYSVYLKDKYTGRVQNLHSSPEYTFEISNGTINERFELIISNKVLTQNAFGTDSFNAHLKDGCLIVTLNLREEQVLLQVTDLLGRNIIQNDIFGEGQHNLGHIPAKGVYIISISTDMGTISKKIYLN